MRRTELAIRNYLSDSIPEILITFLGLFRIKLFLLSLGGDSLGLYQLYGQLFAYLALAEAGFSSGALYSLYKPLVANDHEKTSRLLSGIRFIYSAIGGAILASGLALSFFVPFFVKGAVFLPAYMQQTFLLFLLLNTIQFFTMPYEVIFDASQMRFVPNAFRQTGLIVKTLVEIVLLMLHQSLVVLLVASIAIIGITNLSMYLYAKRKFPHLNFRAKRDTSMWKDTKYLIVHKIGGLVANNIDIVLVSKFLGLGYVVLYTAYHFIISALLRIFSRISSALYSIIGRSLITEDKQSVYREFLEYNSLMFYVVTVICVSLAYAINPFVALFYGNDLVASKLITVLFILVLFIRFVRLPLMTYANGAGLFGQTRICTIVEAAINLTGSFFLINLIGIPGLLISTVISILIADFIIKPVIVHKLVFERGSGRFIADCLLCFAIFPVLGAVNLFWLPTLFNPARLLEWLAFCCFLFAVNAVVVYAYFALIKKTDWSRRLLRAWKRRIK